MCCVCTEQIEAPRSAVVSVTRQTQESKNIAHQNNSAPEKGGREGKKERK